MFDKPKYLTGEEGFVQAGDTFWLHNARLDGTVTVNGSEKPQVKLLVSRTKDENPEMVFTSGAGIVNQVSRMDGEDRQHLPMEVRLDQVPSKQGSPTNVLTPAGTPPPETIPDDEPAF
jgi:hypothetical protein